MTGALGLNSRHRTENKSAARDALHIPVWVPGLSDRPLTPENDDEEKEDAGLSGYASIRGKGSKKKVEKIKGGFGAVVGALAQLEANRVETRQQRACRHVRT